MGGFVCFVIVVGFSIVVFVSFLLRSPFSSSNLTLHSRDVDV